METRQHETELDGIDGEPLDGSGFETEEPVAEDELAFTLSIDQQGETL